MNAQSKPSSLKHEPPKQRSSMSPAEVLSKNLEASIRAKQQFLARPECVVLFDAAVTAVVQRYRAGGRLFIAGNGGSAADAQHLAAEFVSKLSMDRAPLPAEALTVDSSILTAIGNDYGFDQIFARQIEGKMSTRDVFLAISTSGQSVNILRALEACRRKGALSLLFTGRGGGPALKLADHAIVATGEMTSTIQELHIVLAHSLCECVERALFPR